MPELPEVEVVRRGLSDHVAGRSIAGVDVLDARSLRRHVAGASDFVDRLAGRQIAAAHRRGKYLWLTLDDGDEAIVVHLGMSGQALVSDPAVPMHRHTRLVIDLSDGRQWRFVDQRIFGGMFVAPVGEEVPAPLSHIARDPLDPLFEVEDWVERLRRRDTGIKRALLDQSLVSGIGNIYADEALWRVPLHFARSTRTLVRPRARELMLHLVEVMTEALDQGGTSFDALYVNVNGQSGYFDRSLNVYGREGEPCGRCGTPIRRVAFMNRSSHFCPRCQRPPR